MINQTVSVFKQKNFLSVYVTKYKRVKTLTYCLALLPGTDL